MPSTSNSRLHPGNVFFAYTSRPEIVSNDLRPISKNTEPMSWLDAGDLVMDKKDGVGATTTTASSQMHAGKTLGVFYAMSIHESHVVGLPFVKVPYEIGSFAKSCSVAERSPATYLPVYPAENGVKLNMQHLHLDPKYDPLDVADFPTIKAPSVKTMKPPLLECDCYIDLATPISVKDTDVEWDREVYLPKQGQTDVLRVIKLYRFVNSLDDPLTKDDPEYYAEKDAISAPRPRQLLGPGAYIKTVGGNGGGGGGGSRRHGREGSVVQLTDDDDARSKRPGSSRGGTGGSRGRNRKRRGQSGGGSSVATGGSLQKKQPPHLQHHALQANGANSAPAAGTKKLSPPPQQPQQQTGQKNWAAVAAGEQVPEEGIPVDIPKHNQAALEQRWDEVYNRRWGQGKGRQNVGQGRGGRGGGGGGRGGRRGRPHPPCEGYMSAKPPPEDAPDHASDTSLDKDIRKQMLGEPWPKEWTKKPDAGQDGDGIVVGLKNLSVRGHGWDLPASNMPSHIHVQEWLGLEGEDRKFKGWAYEDFDSNKNKA